MNGNTSGGEGRGKYGRLMQNTFILTVGTFVSKLLVFLLLPLYTNYLSPSEYSTADLITNLANFLIPIFCFGVSEGVLRFSLREKTKDGKPRYDRKEVFSVCTVITLLGSAVIAVLFPIFYLVPNIGSYGFLVVLYVIASNLHSIAAEYIRACEKTTLYAFQGVLNTALVIALNLIFLLGFDMGIYGYVLSVILADFLTTVFLVFSAHLYRELSLKDVRKKTVKALLKFSMPLILGTLLWWIISVSDRYLITWITGSEANGLYVAAAKIPTLLTLMTTVFLTAWKISAVTEDSGEDAAEKARRGEFYGRVYRGFVAVLFCMGAGITLFSKLFAGILFAEEFYAAWQFIPILTLGTVFYGLSRFLGCIYFVKEKSFRSSLTAAIAATVNIVLNLFLIPHFGAFGAAAATFVAYLVEYVVREIDAQREIKFDSCRLRILLCGVLLVAEVAVVTLELPYWLWIAGAMTVLMIVLSGKTLIEMAKGLLGELTGRSKKVYK